MKCLVYLLIGTFACSLIQAAPVQAPKYHPKFADYLNEKLEAGNYSKDFDGAMKLSKDLLEGVEAGKSEVDKDMFDSLRMFALLQYASESCDFHSSIFIVLNYKATDAPTDEPMTPDDIVKSSILESIKRHNPLCEPQYRIPNPIVVSFGEDESADQDN